MTKTLILVALFFLTPLCYAQLSESDYKKVESTVFESLKNENYLKLNRVTSEGKLSSCELEFGYVYRDFRSQLGKPVIVSGSVSLMISREKRNLLTTLKVVPTIIDVRTEKMVQAYPEYLDLKINKKSLDKFLLTDFRCGAENKGRCIGYGDGKLDVLKIISSVLPFNADIVFSLAKGGYDNSVTLSTLLPQSESIRVRENFNSCMSEIIGELLKEVDRK